MTQHPVFSQVNQLVTSGNYEALKNYLKDELDFRDLSVFKCRTCGEIVAVAPKHIWVASALQGKNPLLEYLILLHIRDNLTHEIFADNMIPASGLIMWAFRRSCEIHGWTLEDEFKKQLPYLHSKIEYSG